MKKELLLPHRPPEVEEKLNAFFLAEKPEFPFGIEAIQVLRDWFEDQFSKWLRSLSLKDLQSNRIVRELPEWKERLRWLDEKLDAAIDRERSKKRGEVVAALLQQAPEISPPSYP